MEEPGQKRKLEAILSADVVGYSRLMQDDEMATVETLTKYRTIFSDLVARHEGRIVDSPGDNVLAEFDSPVEAVECAIEIQRDLSRRNRQLAQHRQMQFRIGINLGDVIVRKDGTIYGDGVNIAARLESLAEPGGICLSETVFLQTEGKVEAAFEDIGAHEVKNIAKPVRTYRVLGEGSSAKNEEAGKDKHQLPMTAIYATGAVIVALVIGLNARFLSDAPPSASNGPQDNVQAYRDGASIIVLPFENQSNDTEQDYFAVGITEQIITELSAFPELRVMARSASFGYMGQNYDIGAIREELGVSYVLTGSVRNSETKLRVNVQLINANTQTQVWAQTYDSDRNVGDILDVQYAISAQVVASIDSNLSFRTGGNFQCRHSDLRCL